MSERSGRDGVHGTESTQPGRKDRNFGKRRRRRGKRRHQPNDAVQMLQPGSDDQDENTHPAGVNGTAEESEVSVAQGGVEKDSKPEFKPRNIQPTNDGKRPVFNRRMKSAYAALDLGTNNCRLLIAVPKNRGRFRIIDGFSRIVRLGENLSQTGELSEAAMDRSIEALKICASKLENRGPKKQRLIATEACRQATNGGEFLDRVKTETGLELEIVTRETEARLAAEGCGSLMDHKSDAAVMFDIGGGSTELILVKGRRHGKGRVADRIAAWTSLPMGVVTLAERFGGENITPELFSEMVKSVVEEITKFDDRTALDASFKAGNAHLLGTSGTVTTLAGVHLELDRYDRRKVDGLWMSDKELNGVMNNLLKMNYEQRAANPCIGIERADLVMAGCAIFEAIRETWPAKRLRVADRGLREGLLAEMMIADNVWRKPRKKRRRFKKPFGTQS